MTTTTATAPRTNRFAAKCANCANTVPAGEGLLSGARGAWTTVHAGTCPPPVARAAAPTETGIFVTPEGTAIKVVKSRESGRLYTKKLVFTKPDARCGAGHGHFDAEGMTYFCADPTACEHAGTMTMDWVYSPGLSVEGLPRLDAAKAAEVGLQCNQCVNCLAPLGGETLSAKVSAMIGYGATCAGGLGWHFPKGVRAQRAFLAERGVVA